MKNVLVIAAHPDDELLGEGGTVRKLVEKGTECRAVIIGEGITSRAAQRNDANINELDTLKCDARSAAKKIGYFSVDFCDLPDNRLDGLELLDVIKVVDFYIDKYKPDTIFTHHHGDLNIDHRIVCEAVLTACRPVGDYTVERIYSFETPSSTEWNYLYENSFRPNVYFDITETLEAKIAGMQCYRSESAIYPHPRSPEALRALSEYRGSTVGVKNAEAFMLLREIIR